MAGGADATVVLCTLDRPAELETCLGALDAQTLQGASVILIREKGALARLRNQGLSRVATPVVCFLDDDTVPSPAWLQSVLQAFTRPAVFGVSGPSVIPDAYLRNRDLFHSRHLKQLHDWLFLDTHAPCHLQRAGTISIIPEDTGYEGRVDCLEACNMSFRTDALKAIGGFDERYAGIGDWSEPDACFRLRRQCGDDCLVYAPGARVEHRPSRSGAYLLRAHTGRRLSNYRLFSRQWVPPHWRHTLYWGWLYAYYGWKECRALISHP